MVTLNKKMLLHIIFFDKKLGGKSRISFEIKDNENLKDVIKEMRSKRLRILEYSIEHRFDVDER